jgi:uncharacterized protein
MERESPPLDTVRFRSSREVARFIAEGGRAVVALSGGVDSATVGLLAHEGLGEEAFAVTLTGPATAQAEIERAQRSAQEIGISHVLIPVDPLAEESYRANPSNRCYFCRRVETKVLRDWGALRAIRQYLDGVHLDDLAEARPGLRAMDEARFVHPLAWGGWRKAHVRGFAQERGLSIWNQPSDACLASRIRQGQPISWDVLRNVERAERWIVSLGFRRVRVRVDRSEARVEVDGTEVHRLLSEPQASEVRRGLEERGFQRIVLDPHGYRPRPGA